MKDLPFVKPEQLEAARAMEEAVLKLPASVVIFVGVSVKPTIDEVPVYYVDVGCPRSMDPEAVSKAVRLELLKKWPRELMDINSFRGVLRKSEVPLTLLSD
jgi:hypothetical protein